MGARVPQGTPEFNLGNCPFLWGGSVCLGPFRILSCWLAGRSKESQELSLYGVLHLVVLGKSGTSHTYALSSYLRMHPSRGFLLLSRDPLLIEPRKIPRS